MENNLSNINRLEIVGHLVKPLVTAGIYKNEETALAAIIIDYINRKKNEYEQIIAGFETKFGKKFDVFSQALTHNASMEDEDQWMEWNGAIEMRDSWAEALQLSVSPS